VDKSSEFLSRRAALDTIVLGCDVVVFLKVALVVIVGAQHCGVAGEGFFCFPFFTAVYTALLLNFFKASFFFLRASRARFHIGCSLGDLI
jgi:hypothetical protein